MQVIRGTNELITNRIGLGCCFSNPLDSPRDIIKAAYNLGIRYFDTAPVYRTETAIGSLIADGSINRKEIIISTKTKAYDGDEISDDIETSLSKLETHYIDMYWLHSGLDSIEEYERIIDSNSFLTLANDERIHYIGISGHDYNAARMAIEDGIVNLIMVPHNILYRRFEPLINLAMERDIGVVPMKNFAGGILTGGPKQFFGDGMISQLINFELTTPGVDMIIPSTRSIEQLKYLTESFILANHMVWDGTREQHFKKLKSRLREVLGNVCTQCHMCRPCYKYGWGVSQPDILRLLTYHEKFGLDVSEEYKKRKFNIRECMGCDEPCTEKCPMNINIFEELRMADKIL